MLKNNFSGAWENWWEFQSLETVSRFFYIYARACKNFTYYWTISSNWKEWTVLLEIQVYFGVKLGYSNVEWNQGEVQKRNRLVNKNGLVANHAYTIFDTARVQNKNNRKVDLLRILSPHSDRSKISKCKSYWVDVKLDGPSVGCSNAQDRSFFSINCNVDLTGIFKITVGMGIGHMIVQSGILWILQ